MTVRRPLETWAPDGPRTEATTAVGLVDPVAGDFERLVADAAADVISLSLRALAIVRAGFAVRALVLYALEEARHIVRLRDGRRLVLDSGTYSAG